MYYYRTLSRLTLGRFKYTTRRQLNVQSRDTYVTENGTSSLQYTTDRHPCCRGFRITHWWLGALGFLPDDDSDVIRNSRRRRNACTVHGEQQSCLFRCREQETVCSCCDISTGTTLFDCSETWNCRTDEKCYSIDNEPTSPGGWNLFKFSAWKSQNYSSQNAKNAAFFFQRSSIRWWKPSTNVL